MSRYWEKRLLTPGGDTALTGTSAYHRCGPPRSRRQMDELA